MSFKQYSKSSKGDIRCFDFHSHYLVLVSLLINMVREMSLLGFRRYMSHHWFVIVFFFLEDDITV